MIVCNESHVILWTLENVLPHIKYWVIVDTGSTDTTPQLIEFFFALHKIPGELHRRPWKHFGANRTEALRLADKCPCSHVFIHDADDLIQGQLKIPPLIHDAYMMWLGSSWEHRYRRILIARVGMFRFERRLHEYITASGYTTGNIDGDYYVESRRTGARGLDPKKGDKDIAILLEDVRKDPLDTRSVFYLADGYRSYHHWLEAIEWYRVRAAMRGYDQEDYMAMYNIGICQWQAARRGILPKEDYKGVTENATNSDGDDEESDTPIPCYANLDEAWHVVMNSFLAAYAKRPSRAEGLARIAEYYEYRKEWALCYGYATWGCRIPMTNDSLFVDVGDYSYKLPNLAAMAANELGKHAEALEYYQKAKAPTSEKERVAKAITDLKKRLAKGPGK